MVNQGLVEETGDACQESQCTRPAEMIRDFRIQMSRP